MIRKTLIALGLTIAMSTSSIAPAFADGAAGVRNVLLGAGAAVFFTQANHNRHQKQMNQNLYNMHREDTFWYNGKKVRCHTNEDGNEACYEKDGDHWNYIPNG